MFYTPGAVAAVMSRVTPAEDPAGTTGGPRKDNDASHIEDFKASFLDKSERDQRTTFYNECSHGFPEHVAWILDQHPAWAKESFRQGGSPLTLAQKAEIVELLLERGAKVDVLDREEFTALHRAADAGDIARAKLLLEHGADINVRHPRHGFTPLHSAVSEDERLNMVRFLIERGADLNVHARMFDVTPVKLALILGFTSSARVMADAGAELDLFSAAGLDKLDELKALAAKTENPWAPDAATGLTPLHAAGLGGAVETTRYLIEQKLDVNAVSKPEIMNFTPLTGAIIHAHPRTVKILLDAGSDPNLPGMRLQTPLTNAFAKRPDGSFPERARMEIVDMLLASGAKVTQETLMEAAQRADGQRIETLLARATELQQGTTEAGESEIRVIRLAEVNPRDTSGKLGTPLHAAASTCNVEAVKVLLAAGADVHARGPRGMTPLNTWMSPERLAGRQRVAETMSLLLAAGADPNTQNDEGETPLHRAGSSGPLETIRVLMLNGADPMIRDKLGRTAIDQAHNPGAREVIQEHLALRRKAVEEDVRGSLHWLLRQIADGTLADHASMHIRLEPPDWTLERWQREAERLNAATSGRTVALMQDAAIEADGDLAVARLQPGDRTDNYFFLILRRIDRHWFATRIGESDASIPPGTHLLNARPPATNPAEAR